MTLLATGRLFGFAVGGTTRFFFQIALPGRVPAVARRPFGIGWRLNVVLPRPGEAILWAEAAALPPTLFGSAATAGMVLAWERLSGLVGSGCSRNRQPQAGHQIGKQCHPGTKPVPHAAPAVGASSHGCQFKECLGGFTDSELL